MITREEQISEDEKLAVHVQFSDAESSAAEAVASAHAAASASAQSAAPAAAAASSGPAAAAASSASSSISVPEPSSSLSGDSAAVSSLVSAGTMGSSRQRAIADLMASLAEQVDVLQTNDAVDLAPARAALMDCMSEMNTPQIIGLLGDTGVGE